MATVRLVRYKFCTWSPISYILLWFPNSCPHWLNHKNADSTKSHVSVGEEYSEVYKTLPLHGTDQGFCERGLSQMCKLPVVSERQASTRKCYQTTWTPPPDFLGHIFWFPWPYSTVIRCWAWGGWVVSMSDSHQCSLGLIPRWGSDPGAISEKGFVPVWATLPPWVGTLSHWPSLSTFTNPIWRTLKNSHASQKE